MSLNLSIVIPTHYRPKSLIRLLSSLVSQSFPRKKFEILIVSNLDDAKLRRALSDIRFSSLPLTLHTVGKVGVNRARNLGLENARAPFVLFLDDDCTLTTPDFLQNVVFAQCRHPNSAAIGGPYKLEPKASWVAQAYHLIQKRYFEQVKINASQTPALLGGNSCYKKKFLGDKQFDESIGFGSAELSLNRHLVEEGHSLRSDKNLGVQHNIRVSLPGLFRKAYLQGINCQEDSTSKYMSTEKLVGTFSVNSVAKTYFLALFIGWFDVFFQKGLASAKKRPFLYCCLQVATSTDCWRVWYRVQRNHIREIFHSVKFVVKNLN